MSRPYRTNTNARSIVTHLASSYPSPPHRFRQLTDHSLPKGVGLEVTVSIPLRRRGVGVGSLVTKSGKDVYDPCGNHTHP